MSIFIYGLILDPDEIIEVTAEAMDAIRDRVLGSSAGRWNLQNKGCQKHNHMYGFYNYNLSGFTQVIKLIKSPIDYKITTILVMHAFGIAIIRFL